MRGAAKISSFEFQYLYPSLVILNELSLILNIWSLGGAFDHQIWYFSKAFEHNFGSGGGKLKKPILKGSNASGVVRGGGKVLKL